jgi:glycosyltransferase involved in cell wall biosynthesis
VARDWLKLLSVSFIVPSLPIVAGRGKFLSREGRKFLLKATRLPDIAGSLDFNEKLALCKRLDHAAAANATALISTAAQAETVLGIAGHAGLYVLVEIAVDPSDLDSSRGLRAAAARIAKTANVLRSYPALLGYLIDCPIDPENLSVHALDQVRRRLATLVSAIRESSGRRLVAFKRRVHTPPLALIDEDLIYATLANVTPAGLRSAILALHNLAGARPLVIEFGEEFPGQEELVAHAFGHGAAGVVAPAMRPAASPGWLNGRMLSAGELPPFATLEGSSTPLPAVMPMVSVVVCARDDDGTISECLESIGRLQYPNYELIVIDHGSHDRISEIAAVPGGARLIRQPGAGFGAARNAAVRAARGELIAFTRADCVVDPDWLTLAVHTMIDGGLDACCGPIYASPENRGLVTRIIASLSSPTTMIAHGDLGVQLTDGNIVVRKASLFDAGGFDPRFDDAGGDIDLSARMIDAGLGLGWCPAGTVWRREGDTPREFYERRIRRGRADALLAMKYPARFSVCHSRAYHGPNAGSLAFPLFDRRRDRVFARMLYAGLASTGAVVRLLAHFHAALTHGHPTIAVAGTDVGESDTPQRLSVATHHAQAAHPAGR